MTIIMDGQQDSTTEEATDVTVTDVNNIGDGAATDTRTESGGAELEVVNDKDNGTVVDAHTNDSKSDNVEDCDASHTEESDAHISVISDSHDNDALYTHVEKSGKDMTMVTETEDVSAQENHTDNSEETPKLLNNVQVSNGATIVIEGSDDARIALLDPEHTGATNDIHREDPKDKPDVHAVVTEMDVEVVPDGGWGWLVVCGTFFIILFTGGLLKSGGVLYLKFLDKFGENALTTAWVFSLHSTVHLLPAPIASGLTERYSPKSVVYFGTFLAVIGMLSSTFSHSIYPMYFTFSIVVGFGKCLIYTSSLIIITQYFTKRRGLATGIASAGGGVGVMFFPPFIEWLFTVYDYKGAMLIMTGITMQTFVCGALFRSIETHKTYWRISERRRQLTCREPNETTEFLTNGTISEGKQTEYTPKTSIDNGTITDTEPSPTAIVNKRKSSTGKSIREHMSKLKSRLLPKNSSKKKAKLLDFSLLKDFVFLSLCIAIFTYTMSMFITLVFIPPLAKSKGISEVRASLIISIMGLSDTIARILTGFLFDLRCVKPYRLYVYNGVLFGLALVSMTVPLVESFLGFAVVAVSYGVLMGCYTSQKTVVVVDVIGTEKMAASFGLLLLFQGIGSLIGPTFSGLFKDMFGGYDEGFYLGGISLFCGASLFMVGNIYRTVTLKRQRKAELTDQDS